VFSEEPLDVVDERDCGFFDGRSQCVWGVQVEIRGQVALKNRVDAFRRRDNTVLGPLAVFEQFPVLSLNLPVASREPGFESKDVLFEDNGDLQVAMLER